MYEAALRSGHGDASGLGDFVGEYREYTQAHLAAGRITESHGRELTRRLDRIALLAPGAPRESAFTRLSKELSEFETYWSTGRLVALLKAPVEMQIMAEKIKSFRTRSAITIDEAKSLKVRLHALWDRAKEAEEEQEVL